MECKHNYDQFGVCVKCNRIQTPEEWREEENTAWCPRCIEDWTDDEGKDQRGTKVPSACEECGVCSECEHLQECSQANV